MFLIVSITKSFASLVCKKRETTFVKSIWPLQILHLLESLGIVRQIHYLFYFHYSHDAIFEIRKFLSNITITKFFAQHLITLKLFELIDSKTSGSICLHLPIQIISGENSVAHSIETYSPKCFSTVVKGLIHSVSDAFNRTFYFKVSSVGSTSINQRVTPSGLTGVWQHLLYNFFSSYFVFALFRPFNGASISFTVIAI